MSSSLDKKREEFRKYLESAGAIDNLTRALVKLYEQKNKPQDAVKFIRKEMCLSCHDEEQYELLAADLDEANQKICLLEREIARLRGEVKRSPSEIELALISGFEELSSKVGQDSMLKRTLKKEVVEKAKKYKTEFKGTLLDCIQSGLEIYDSPVGAFACDPEAYTLFEKIFDPIIEILHDFTKEDSHPSSFFGEACKLPELDPTFVKTIRISCRRNVVDYPFASIMSFEQYGEIAEKLAKVAKCLCGNDLKGKFYPLDGISNDTYQSLVKEGLMFTDDNQYLKAANASRFWPANRAIYVNENMSFCVWCNKDDHFKFIGIDPCGNLRSAYEILIAGVTQISKDIPMVSDERLGFLTFSPINLGNTIRVSIRLELEKLPRKDDKLNEIVKMYHMRIRKLSSDESDDNENLYEIESERCMGLNEFETVKECAEGVIALIDAEKLL